MRRAQPVVRYELERRCEEVLHYVWDPIGVAGEPGARDEYVGYFPHVCALLRNGATEDDIIRYLGSAVGEAMGLEPDTNGTARAATILIQWRDWLDEAPLTEADFWARLEFRLCREFDGYEEWRKLGLWCDGIYAGLVALDSSPQVIEGEAWIGLGPRNQERWSFRLTLPERVDRRSEIEWTGLLPADDVTRWLSVDREAGHLEINPGVAVPDETN
jgi:hypothetical protein